jgi:anti-sigma factor RsiW
MGQAKQRGSFEQRKAEAIEQQKILEAERAARRAKTPINLINSKRTNRAIVAGLIMAATAGMPRV